MSNVKLLVLLAACFIGSCKQKHGDENLEALRSQKIDTAIKDIPVDSKGNFLYYYAKKKELESKIDLPSIEGGVDSIEIRIWYGIALSDSLNLVVLKKNKIGWTGNVFFLKYNFDKKRNFIVSVDKKRQEKTPISGWNSFSKDIFNLKIFSLVDCSKIEGYGDCSDGYATVFEVATVNNYRIYNYTCFREYPAIWQTKNIENIMTLISSEFDFRWIKMPS